MLRALAIGETLSRGPEGSATTSQAQRARRPALKPWNCRQKIKHDRSTRARRFESLVLEGHRAQQGAGADGKTPCGLTLPSAERHAADVQMLAMLPGR